MFLFTFKEFYVIHEAEEMKADGVHAFQKQHPKDPNKFFVVLYGNTFPIKNKLKDLGFSYFQGTWSTRADFLTDEKKKELMALGVNLDELGKGVVVSPKTTTLTEPASPVHSSNTDNMLNQMNQVVDAAIQAETNSETKKLLEDIDKKIAQLASSTDEAAKQDFILAFLKFSSKFHNYSFANQLLIWIQTRGKASSVASATNWQKMGRTVTDWKSPIKIWAPNFKKTTKEIQDPTTGEKKIEPVQLKFFKLVSVYDVDSTTEIPNHPNPYKPISRKQWSVDPNEDIEELNVLVNATLEFIKENNIDFDYQELEDELGGFSAGGKVRINNKFKGINAFSTIVHELAHELLHQKDKDIRKQSSRQEKEIEAESTAFIVLNHFGFETKDAPNYLALWRASGENIKERAQQISVAAKTIINGIKKHMENVELHLGDED
jgi:hypothetical protein